MTRETVFFDTAAIRAISLIVVRLRLRSLSGAGVADLAAGGGTEPLRADIDRLFVRLVRTFIALRHRPVPEVEGIACAVSQRQPRMP